MHRSYLLSLFLTWLIGCSFSVMAQPPTDDWRLPDPLRNLETSFYPVWKKPMQSFICILDQDTISKTIFSKEGHEIEYREYNKGKLLYRSVHTFAGGRKQQTLFYANNQLQSKASYSYDAAGNLLEWKRVNQQYNKSNQPMGEKTDVHWQYRYNQRKRVSEKFRLDLGAATVPVYAYTYDDQGRVTAIHEQQWNDQFTYENDRLIRKERFFQPDHSLYASNIYEYNPEGLLIASSDKFYNGRFQYAGAQLSQALYRRKRDSSYQEISFQYQQALLQTVSIRATDPSLQPAFVMKSDYFYANWKTNSVNQLKYELVYDAQQNITEIRYYCNDRYLYSKRFVYRYY